MKLNAELPTAQMSRADTALACWMPYGSWTWVHRRPSKCQVPTPASRRPSLKTHAWLGPAAVTPLTTPVAHRCATTHLRPFQRSAYEPLEALSLSPTAQVFEADVALASRISPGSSAGTATSRQALPFQCCATIRSCRSPVTNVQALRGLLAVTADMASYWLTS
ncbi:hypothetical protein LUX57_26280 [Actinomadura madurae]|uniref:hypothetical protein n=1 Tax=Actinomadura madurae TaxID=1993 RepID=UPI0020D24390|nr:hypothetical protein [Actinomadura madurae]MCP9968236.1 hypothetical protein [Actinomadura madurae]